MDKPKLLPKLKPKLKPKTYNNDDIKIIEILEAGKEHNKKEINTIKDDESDKFNHLQFDWLKHRHSESLKMIVDNLPKNYNNMNDLDVFSSLEKSGIIQEVCIDNFISRNLQFYPDKVFLLLEMVQSAVENDINSARKVYKPASSISDTEVNDLIEKTINEMKLLMGKQKNDIDIITRLGFKAYKVIKFTLYQTQNIDIKPSALLSSHELVNYMSKVRVSKYKHNYNNMPSKIYNIVDTHLYEVIYQEQKEMQNNFFFHGSPFMNWYSIINNGLYVPKTEQILHGNAYGSGIYLAKCASTSAGYMGQCKGKCIMGIAQVNDPQKYYKNSGNYLVVNNAEDVQLKYIIVFNASNDNVFNNIAYQATYLTTKLGAIKQKNDIESNGKIHNRICIKRINKELKIISQIDKIYDYPINVEYDESIIDVWTITIDTPKDKWGTMVWEIRFDNDYPVKPPFVRIIRPHFKYLSGHITVGGAFCNPILTNQKWRATISIVNLIELLLVNMEDGGAELDNSNKKTPYTLGAAKKAYIRYKNAHGWD